MFELLIKPVGEVGGTLDVVAAEDDDAFLTLNQFSYQCLVFYSEGLIKDEDVNVLLVKAGHKTFAEVSGCGHGLAPDFMSPQFIVLVVLKVVPVSLEQGAINGIMMGVGIGRGRSSGEQPEFRTYADGQ